MKRKLPLITISGTAFIVDVVTEEFRQHNYEINRIGFDQLISRNGWYVLLFDPKTNNAWPGDENKQPMGITEVNIPPLCRLDAVGLSVKHHIALREILSMKDDSEWLSLPGMESVLKMIRQQKPGDTNDSYILSVQQRLRESLFTYITTNNPELIVGFNTGYTITQFVEDKVGAILPLIEQLKAEDRPGYIIEETCFNEMTEDLRPSKFNYIKAVLEEEFSADFKRLAETGVLTYETINLIDACKEVFNDYGFSQDNEEDRFLRYAVIAAIHDYFN